MADAPTYLDFDIAAGSQKLRNAVTVLTPNSIVATGPDGLIAEELIPPGTDGADGNTVLSGVGVPSNDNGVDGDFYINTGNHSIYGPKTAGAWGSGTSLVGATGDPGPQGDTGPPGANGSPGADGATWYSGSGAPGGGLGANGDFYFRTDTGQVYSKSAGSWGAIANLTGPTGAAGAAGPGLAAGGTTGQVARKASNTNYDTEWHTLAKADVGLGNVDDTSDAGKPVSTAQQAALDLKVATSTLDTDGTLAANSDSKLATQKATKTYADTKQAALGFTPENSANKDTDGTLAANSDTKYASQKAVKTYVDTVTAALVGAADAMVFKGVIDCSGNPNYPAADAGHTYRVSVAGKIGGASGANVEAGEILLCLTDGTSAGTQAGVGANWSIVQANIDGAVIGPTSVTDGNIAVFDGTSGKLIKDSGLSLSGTNTGDQTITLTGDVIGSGTGSFAATIANDAVSYAKLQNVSATDKLLGRSTAGAGDVEEITCTAAGRALIDDADAATMRATLGLVIGTNVQAYDADLATWAGVTPSANGQSLVSAADYAAMRTLLGLVIGTNVQAYDADLTTWAGLTPSAFFQTLVDDADAGTARTTLGFGTGYTVNAVATATASTNAARDANINSAANRWSNAAQARAGGTSYVLTNASPPIQIVTGNSNTTYQLPDATTLQQLGDGFSFLNMGTGTITVQDAAAGAIATIGSGGNRTVVARSIATSAGIWDYTGDVANASGLSWGTVAAARLPQFTGGDVTTAGAGSVSLTLGNIPSGTPMAGSLLATAIAAPGTPASGKGSIYVDSTSKNVCVKDDAGTVKHGVQTKAAVANSFVTAIDDAGAVTVAQPAFSNISGSVAAAQLPNPSASTLGGIQSLAAVASKWINTISTSGVPSATQPAFTDISGSVAASQMPALTGDVTTSAGAVATTIGANKVTRGMLATGTARTVIGRSANSTGDVADINGAGAKTVLRDSGTALAFTQLAGTDLSDSVYGTAVNFSAGNFTASGSMTWTVESGDQSVFEYAIANGVMDVWWEVVTSTVGGSLDRFLQLTIPASKTALVQCRGLCEWFQGTWTVGRWTVTASGNLIKIDKLDSSNFASSTNNTYTMGHARFPIN